MKTMVQRTFKIALAAGALCVLSAGAAQAQVPASATSTADPGRVQGQFEAPVFDPSIAPKIEVKEILPQNAPAGAENIELNLSAIDFDGLVAYTPEDLAPIYADSLGQTITLADVYTIANQMTARYRNDGYILTQVVIPPQTIDDGAVTFKVVEGFIDQVSVEGVDDFSGLQLVQAYADNIRTGGALNIEELERYLLLINDLPGVSARSVIAPSVGAAGAADLKIIVSRDASDGSIAIDNFGSRFIGPIQISGDYSLNSHFGLNERITARSVYAPSRTLEPELAYFALNYEQPIGTLGTRFELAANYSETDPGFDLEVFDISGRSQFLGAAVYHPFIRSRGVNLTGRAKLDWRDVKSSSLIFPTVRDDIRAARLGGTLDFLDTAFGVAYNSIDIELSQGLDVLGATADNDINVTRQAGDATFFKANATIQRIQRLSNKVNLLTSVEGQWSATPLYSSEEFGVGGTNIGRGYDSSEIIGDDGIAGKVEVQWNNPYATESVEDYQVYGFYDIGRVWDQDAVIAANRRQSIASTGFGVRATLVENLEAQMLVAVPLTREVQTQSDNDPRFYFSLKRNF